MHDWLIASFGVPMVKDHDAWLRHRIGHHFVAVACQSLPSACDDAHLIAIVPDAMPVAMPSADDLRHCLAGSRSGVRDIAQCDAVR